MDGITESRLTLLKKLVISYGFDMYLRGMSDGKYDDFNRAAKARDFKSSEKKLHKIYDKLESNWIQK